MWNDIANMSAIATLILFIFYFLGRLWCIRVEKKDLYEKIIVRGVDLKDDDLNIEYVNGDEIIEIISEKYLNWIKVYAAEYVEGKVKKASKTNSTSERRKSKYPTIFWILYSRRNSKYDYRISTFRLC